MPKKREPLKVKSFLNEKNEDGTVTPVLIKDVDGVIKPEYEELWYKACDNMMLRCAKIYAAKNGFDLEITEKE